LMTHENGRRQIWMKRKLETPFPPVWTQTNRLQHKGMGKTTKKNLSQASWVSWPPYECKSEALQLELTSLVSQSSMYSLEWLKQQKMNMRFGTWKIMSLYWFIQNSKKIRRV
jgi:hypothetical protein